MRLHIRLMIALCHYRQNDKQWQAEISAVPDTAYEYIKLATVKTHVIHILQKPGVKRRREAKNGGGNAAFNIDYQF